MRGVLNFIIFSLWTIVSPFIVLICPDVIPSGEEAEGMSRDQLHRRDPKQT